MWLNRFCYLVDILIADYKSFLLLSTICETRVLAAAYTSRRNASIRHLRGGIPHTRGGICPCRRRRRNTFLALLFFPGVREGHTFPLPSQHTRLRLGRLRVPASRLSRLYTLGLGAKTWTLPIPFLLHTRRRPKSFETSYFENPKKHITEKKTIRYLGKTTLANQKRNELTHAMNTVYHPLLCCRRICRSALLHRVDTCDVALEPRCLRSSVCLLLIYSYCFCCCYSIL